MVDITDPEHLSARAELVVEEGKRWRSVHAQALDQLPAATTVIIDITTGEYVTGENWHAARRAFQQTFGALQRLSYSFDVDRPIFVGGGIWRRS